MQRLRILVAEDDKLSATLLKAMLEAEGHTVCDITSTGRATIAAAIEQRPDAVLMDIYLEDELSGAAAARNIVQEIGIPTIFITGASDPAIMDVAAESGALSFIKKPVSADELRANLRILLHNKDVTERLGGVVKRQQALFDGAPMGIFLCRKDGTLLECNMTLATAAGFSSPAALMQQHTHINTLYADEDRYNLITGILSEGACVNGISGQLQKTDGAVAGIREYGSSYLRTDGTEGYQGMLYIVPANTCQEDNSACYVPGKGRFLRSILDAVPDLLVVMDFERNIVEANRAFYRQLGGAEGVLEQRFPYVGEENICTGECPFSRFLADKCEHTGWVRLVAGGPEYYNTVSPVTDESGKVIAAVQVFRAIPRGSTL